jgi:hypothetical protein
MKLEISRQFQKKNLKIKFLKIRPVGVELFHVDRQMDGHDAKTFSQFRKRA